MEDDTSQNGTDGPRSGDGRWLTRNTSVATRLALSALVVSITSLIVTGLVSAGAIGERGNDLLRGRLPQIAAAKSTEVESYLGTVMAQVASLAASGMITEGVQDFAAAYDELATLTRAETDAARLSVGGFYLDEFVPSLNEVRAEPVSPESVAPGENPATWYLQDTYIASSPLSPEERDLLADGRDGSRWTDVHVDLHPTLLGIVSRLGFADLYLIEPERGTVVYSTAKNVDFATSLDAGPHSGSALARLADEVVATGEAGAVSIVDLSNYAPRLDQPSLFIGAPIFDGDRLVGVLAVNLPTEDVDAIMTRDWREGRLGETGEVYLIGDDETMRSVSRAFVEDPGAYFDQITAAGTADDADVASMEQLGTTVLVQEVDADAAAAPQGTDTEPVSTTSYLGEDVYTADHPVGADTALGTLEWTVIAEQGRAEVDGAVNDFDRESTIFAAIFVVALTFLMVIWANAFVGPLRRISAALQRAREGDLETEVPASGAREFRELADSFNQMVDDLDARRRRVSQAVAAKLAMLRTLLPPAAVRSVGQGDRSSLETIPQATVVVLVAHGLDELVRLRSAAGTREILHTLVDELDGLAEINGLERVKVMGDTYYAACGLDTPYPDHAPRSVTFALQAREMMRRLDAAESIDLDLSAGCHSGSVTVGLTAGSRLMYDLWGDTATTAHRLARVAGPGEILVSEETRSRLPAEEATRPADHAEDVPAWVVVDSRAEVRP